MPLWDMKDFMLKSKIILFLAWLLSLAFFAGVFLWGQASYDQISPEASVSRLPDKTGQKDNPDANSDDDIVASQGDAPPTQGEVAVSIPLYSPDLVEKTPLGDLPRIGEKGRLSWQAYSSPGVAPSDERARIAIIIRDMGLRARNTKTALDTMPAQVTFAFSPYGKDLDLWAKTSRQKGHEILLAIPMESVNLVQENPGELALLADRTRVENTRRLHVIMTKMHGYTGMIPHMGSRFTATVEDIQGPILDELKLRGLLFVDNRSNPNSLAVQFSRNRQIPSAYVNRHIDTELVQAKINAELLELEARAKQFGAAVGEAQAIPISLKAIESWIATLDPEEIVLVPVSHVIERQPTPRR